MTANEILNKYLEALKMLEMSDSGGKLQIENIILDILKYLDYKESGGDADQMILRCNCKNLTASGGHQPECPLFDTGEEPYIPSVHFKNIAPYDFIKTDVALDFLKKLENYEAQMLESYQDFQAAIESMKER